MLREHGESGCPKFGQRPATVALFQLRLLGRLPILLSPFSMVLIRSYKPRIACVGCCRRHPCVGTREHLSLSYLRLLSSQANYSASHPRFAAMFSSFTFTMFTFSRRGGRSSSCNVQHCSAVWFLKPQCEHVAFSVVCLTYAGRPPLLPPRFPVPNCRPPPLPPLPDGCFGSA